VVREKDNERTAPTLRAVIDDIAGAVHRTSGNIADRTGLPVEFLTALLLTLEKKGIVECVDHMEPQPFQRPRHATENWAWELKHPRDRVIAILAETGYDPDAKLTPGA
jgi:hypothetical protein